MGVDTDRTNGLVRGGRGARADSRRSPQPQPARQRMLTNPRRRCRGPAAAAALGLLVGLPAIAEAQLFPNLPIRRARPDCDHEAPVFQLYRHEYFGYHPTCWRRFPPGWGCPNPEAPNSAQAMQEIQDELQRQPAEPAPPAGEGGVAPEAEGPQTPAPPPLPPDRSPFEMDTPLGPGP